MSQIQSTMQHQFKYLDLQIARMQKSFEEDFCYALAWYGEDMFMATYKVEKLKKIYSQMTDENEVEVAKRWVAELTEFVKRSYNVRENCTGALHREASTWKYIATLDLIDFLEKVCLA